MTTSAETRAVVARGDMPSIADLAEAVNLSQPAIRVALTRLQRTRWLRLVNGRAILLGVEDEPDVPHDLILDQRLDHGDVEVYQALRRALDRRQGAA